MVPRPESWEYNNLAAMSISKYQLPARATRLLVDSATYLHFGSYG